MDWFTNLGNSILMFIDGLVYGCIYIFYKLIMCLANVQIFGDLSDPNSETLIFNEFAQRIYVLLGIFMIFRLGFSFLQYIIDPDKATDKSVGAGKILTNCVVSLVLLVVAPTIFTQMYKLQSLILSDNILGNLIFGSDAIYSGDNEQKSLDSVAKDTQYLLFGAFFQVNPDVVGVKDTGGESVCADNTVLGSVGMARNSECLTAVNEVLQKGGLTINQFYYTGNGTEDNRSFNNYQNAVNIKINDEYAFTYNGLISTLAGVLVVYMLLTFCIDIAIRVFYLGFLQLIAPIPIISYMDPKQTFSNGIFSNWLKEVGKTFISVFIRLAAIFLAIYFIQIINDALFVSENELYASNNGLCENCDTMNPWVYVFLVIGAFLFAKKVPQYIETIFGFKSSGDMMKNPLAKMKESSMLSGIAGGIGGGAIGAGLGLVASVNEGRSQGESKGRLFASGIAGFGSGLARGTFAGGKNFQKGDWIKGSVRTAGDVAFAKEIRREAGSFAVLRNTVKGATNQPYLADTFDKQIGVRQDFINNAKETKALAEDMVQKRSEAYKTFKEGISIIRNTGGKFSFNGKTYDGSKAEDLHRAENDLYDLMKLQADQFANTGTIEAIAGIDKQDLTGEEDYKQIESYKEANKRILKENHSLFGLTRESAERDRNYKQIMDLSDEAKTQNVAIKSSDEYENAKKEKEIRQKYARNDWTNEHR